jgi:hypothetical protein
MKLTFIVLFALGLLTSAFADSWSPPEPIASASPSGRYVLRVIPSDTQAKSPPVAVVFELSRDGGSFTKKGEFQLVNKRAPVEACISDSGEVYTFDDWGRMGYDHAAVWYSADGKKKAEFSLAQLFPAKVLAAIEKDHRTVSSVHWRRGRPYINGPHVIIDDALGGYITLTQGVIDYYPPEKK